MSVYQIKKKQFSKLDNLIKKNVPIIIIKNFLQKNFCKEIIEYCVNISQKNPHRKLTKEGDYFSYGSSFFEITTTSFLAEIFGEIEYKTGVKLVGKQARKGLIDKEPIGPTDDGVGDNDAIQDKFVQQRGESENSLGETGDVRALQEQGKLDAPAEGPREVSPRGDEDDISSSFYGD